VLIICGTPSSLAYGTTKTRAKWCGKPDSCSIRLDRGFEIFSFLQSNAGLQLLYPPLQCLSILAQYRNRLHVSTLIAPGLKIVDILPELIRERVNFVNGRVDRCGSFPFHRAPPVMLARNTPLRISPLHHVTVSLKS
jgi:hypothetical protein